MKTTPLKRKTPLKKKALKRKTPLKKKAIKKKAPKKLATLRATAKDHNCTVRVPNVCRNRRDTTVLAHLNGGGTGMKSPDHHAAFACFECHTWLDHGYIRTHTREMRDLYHYAAIMETQSWWVANGYITIKGE